MDIKEINAPAIKQHNAQFSREVEVTKEFDRLLQIHRFPYQRIWVDLRFDYGLADHSASKLTHMLINGDLHGTAEVKLQGLYMWQDFKTFIEEVLPHELAHVLVEYECARRGIKVDKPHDEMWMDTLLDINPDCEATAKVNGDFDDRPVKLKRGGIGAICECGDSDAFIVVANTPNAVMKLKNEEHQCSNCHYAYRRLAPHEWPEEIKAKYQFYEGVDAQKLHKAPLAR